jgi:hypothetical protein
VNCVRVNREFPSRDIPISEGGGIAEGVTVGTCDSRGELEELRLFGPVVKKVLVGAACSLRGRLRQVVSEPEKGFSLFGSERRAERKRRPECPEKR